MGIRLFPTFLALSLACVPAAASASNPFVYSYGAETEEKGETEATLWVTQRSGKGAGTYRARDLLIEVERGLTDRLQASFYLTFDAHRVGGLEPRFGNSTGALRFNGAKASVAYMLRSPEDGNLGIALYLEPGFSRFSGTSGERRTALTLESKVMLEQRFTDRLRWVGNLTLEQEFEHGERVWNKELEAEVSTGLAYRVAGGLHLGGEARIANRFAGFPDTVDRSAWAVFAGPTAHYDGGAWFASMSVQHQLAGGPGASSRNLDEFEKNEARLKLGVEF